MKFSKVVFIANALGQPRVKKRIMQFIRQGYKVEVYGFDRDKLTDVSGWGVEVTMIGRIPSKLPYARRIGVIYRGIRQVLRRSKCFILSVSVGHSLDLFSAKPSSICI